MKQTIIELTEKYVYNQLNSDASGHDWFHIDRVRKLALHIAREEKKEMNLSLNWRLSFMIFRMIN